MSYKVLSSNSSMAVVGVVSIILKRMVFYLKCGLQPMGRMRKSQNAQTLWSLWITVTMAIMLGNHSGISQETSLIGQKGNKTRIGCFKCFKCRVFWLQSVLLLFLGCQRQSH